MKIRLSQLYVFSTSTVYSEYFVQLLCSEKSMEKFSWRKLDIDDIDIAISIFLLGESGS